MGLKDELVEAAIALGWTWLSVQCPTCRRRKDIPLSEIAAAQPGVRLTGYMLRLRCGACGAMAVDPRLAKSDDGRGNYRTEVVVLIEDET